MKLKEFQEAVALAKSDQEINDDDNHLHGCALPGFTPVVTSLRAVARLLRWQAQMLNGEWDHEELNKMWKIARYRFLVV